MRDFALGAGFVCFVVFLVVFIRMIKQVHRLKGTVNWLESLIRTNESNIYRRIENVKYDIERKIEAIATEVGKTTEGKK